MPPPAPQPRRHPDFAKEPQSYHPSYGQPRQQIYGIYLKKNYYLAKLINIQLKILPRCR